jgi:GNAT superfamily N-acetyltransferase
VISRRPATAGDLEFLYRLTRESLGPWVIQTFGPWDDAAQRERFFRETLVETHEVVERDGEPIGCLCTSIQPGALKLHRVFLLPAAQGRGLGTALVREVMAAARARGLPLRLRVLRVNPARNLYERLGFRVTGETETHFEMEHSAP